MALHQKRQDNKGLKGATPTWEKQNTISYLGFGRQGAVKEAGGERKEEGSGERERDSEICESKFHVKPAIIISLFYRRNPKGTKRNEITRKERNANETKKTRRNEKKRARKAEVSKISRNRMSGQHGAISCIRSLAAPALPKKVRNRNSGRLGVLSSR